MHGKFSLCFNSSLLKQSSCRNLHFLNFIGRLFHKTLPLKVNEFIPYFWVFTFRIESKIPLLSKYKIAHETYGLSVILDLHVSMAKNCRCLWWVFSLLSKVKTSSYLAMCCYTPLVKFYIYRTFSTIAYFLYRTFRITGNRQIEFLSLDKLRFWLFLILETFVVFLGYIVYNTLLL